MVSSCALVPQSDFKPYSIVSMGYVAKCLVLPHISFKYSHEWIFLCNILHINYLNKVVAETDSNNFNLCNVG